jgi:hypothetical protein
MRKDVFIDKTEGDGLEISVVKRGLSSDEVLRSLEFTAAVFQAA